MKNSKMKANVTYEAVRAGPRFRVRAIKITEDVKPSSILAVMEECLFDHNGFTVYDHYKQDEHSGDYGSVLVIEEDADKDIEFDYEIMSEDTFNEQYEIVKESK